MAKSKVDLFLDMMFHTADQTHVWHLQTKSYAMHKALNGYYDGIRAQTDRFAEAAMGYMGKSLSADGKVSLQGYKDEKQVMNHIMAVCTYCNDLYSELKGQKNSEHLLAIVDDIKELLATTKYLLTLK